MKTDKVKYTAHYEAGRKVAEWIGIEASPDEGETPDQVFKAAQDQVKKWHDQSNAENIIPGQQGPVGELPVINRAQERLLVLIEGAQSVDELNSYYQKAKNSNLTAEYDRKYKELTSK